MLEIEVKLFLQPIDRLIRSVNAISHLSRVWNLIETEWRDSTLTLQRASRAGGLNSNDLNVLLRGVTGFTFYQLLIRYRLLRAITMMTTMELTVTDIALDNGFGSVNTFERNFRNVIGMTPRIFLTQCFDRLQFVGGSATRVRDEQDPVPENVRACSA